jgi:nucleoside-diphosphate-sugar epimerase
MYLLITGGSGFIGTQAVKMAAEYTEYVANIDIKNPNVPSQRNYWKAIDITDHNTLAQIFQEFQPTHILHLAAKTGMDLKGLHELPANIDGVKNLVEIASQCESVQRVVFVSSLLVCKNGYIPKHDEDYCPPNYYGESKMIGEQIVRSADAPFEWSIVRPTSIWGPWFEHSYKTFFRTIDKGLYFHIGGEPIVKPNSYVGNAVHMMYKLLFHPTSEVHRQTYYLSDWPEATTNEWAEEINRQLSGKPIRTIPLPILRGVAKGGDVLKKLGKEPPLTTFRLNNMLTGGSYPVENTRRIVGDLPYSLSDGVRETIDWMRIQGLLR